MASTEEFIQSGRSWLYPIGREYAHRFRHRGLDMMLRALHPIESGYGFVRTVPFVNKLRLKVDTSTYIGWKIYFYGVYRPEYLAVTLASLREGDTALDVGASIGDFVVAMASAVGSRGAVHAFEPWPSEYERCAENILLNGFNNVVLNREAVAQASQMSVIYGSGGANQSNSRLEVAFSGSGLSHVCPTTSIDDYMQKLQRLDFLKIDSQGSDLRVLDGAQATIETWRPILFLSSVNYGLYGLYGTSIVDVYDFLVNRNYTIHRIDEMGRLSDPDLSGRIGQQAWLGLSEKYAYRLSDYLAKWCASAVRIDLRFLQRAQLKMTAVSGR